LLGCERKAAPPILIVILVLWSIDVVIVIVSGRSRWLVAPVSLIVVISTIVISGVFKVLSVPRLINMVIAVLSTTAIATLPWSRRILEIGAALLIVSRIRVLLVVLLLFLDLVGDALRDILNSTLDDVSSDIATRSLVPEELRLNVKHARGQNVVGYDKAVKDKAESLLT
jgi:hypothetical protein